MATTEIPDAMAVEGQRAADQLFRRFERMIMSGELKDGETLPPEREIVDRFGVSRTVVREAILALSNRGLVEARPRFRPVVRRPDFDTAINTVGSVIGLLLDQPEGIKNLFDTRTMVEASLVREAAKSAKRTDLEAMKVALDANGNAIHDSQEFFKTDIEFHGVLYRVSGNPVLPAIHKAYTNWLAPQWTQMPRSPERNEKNFKAHTSIYEAILMRDPDEAEACLREHLANAWEQVRRTFNS